MEFPRPRHPKQSVEHKAFLVRSQRSWFNKLIAWLITGLMWAYTFLVILFFVSAFTEQPAPTADRFKQAFKLTNTDIRGLVILILVLFALFFGSLLIWRNYNKRRFGSLNRRVYPKPTTREDLLGLDLIDEKTLDQLQNSKVVVFEKSPVKDLETVKKQREARLGYQSE